MEMGGGEGESSSIGISVGQSTYEQSHLRFAAGSGNENGEGNQMQVDGGQTLSLPFHQQQQIWTSGSQSNLGGENRITDLYRAAMGMVPTSDEASTSTLNSLGSTSGSCSSSNLSFTSNSDRSNESTSPDSYHKSKSDSDSPEGDTDIPIIGSATSTDLTSNSNINYSYAMQNRNSPNTDFSDILSQILNSTTPQLMGFNVEQAANFFRIRKATLKELTSPLVVDKDSKWLFPERHFCAALYTNALALGFSREELDDCAGISRIGSSWPPRSDGGLIKVRERFGNSVTGGIGPYTYGQGQSISLMEIVEEGDREHRIEAEKIKRKELLENEEMLKANEKVRRELRWDTVPSNMYPTRSQILME